MNRETILIVEDEQPIAHVLTTVLSANGYHTLQASTGSLARSIINSHCPSLILLDLGLPDVDGLELLRWLRGWSGVPVLVVSAEKRKGRRLRHWIWGQMTISPSLLAPRSCWHVSVLRCVTRPSWIPAMICPGEAIRYVT